MSSADNQNRPAGAPEAADPAGYRVLARKYRPATFDDLIGQEAMVRTVSNAFDTGRIPQAWILTGVRGVGKTTTARILARALNYELPDGSVTGPTIHMPVLGVHDQAIMESRHLDVLEMDAASHNSVDDVRQINDAIRYAPVSARYKVYILDEVHMLSGAAFNALLKTLEEPPGDARLLLSCAAPDALPPTIRSRCHAVALQLPEPALASRWLAEQAVAQPDVMLAATGGQPQDALAWARDGVDARQWVALPRQLAAGDGGGLAGWPLPRVVDVLQKLCHDAMRLAAGAAPRYFPAAAMPAAPSLQALSAWARELGRLSRQAEHPWNAGLMVESLTQQARAALSARA
jgi:hypothetical protein